MLQYFSFFHLNLIKNENFGIWKSSSKSLIIFFHPVSCVTFETGSFKDLLPWKDNMASYGLDSKNLYIKKIITILEMSLIFLIGRSIVCHDALSFETSTNHFVQRIEVWQQMNMSNQGVAQTFLTFFPREVQFALILQFFLHEICLIIFWREIFAENVVSGNSVQIGPNFPAKSLSIYTKNFSPHF